MTPTLLAGHLTSAGFTFRGANHGPRQGNSMAILINLVKSRSRGSTMLETGHVHFSVRS